MSLELLIHHCIVGPGPQRVPRLRAQRKRSRNLKALKHIPFTLSPDRRINVRFDLQLDATYTILQHNRVFATGSGKTLDMSSGGLLLKTEGPVPCTSHVRISVAWPARLQNGMPLKLFLQGYVLRSESNYAAIRIRRYEFRTRPASSLVPDSRVA